MHFRMYIWVAVIAGVFLTAFGYVIYAPTSSPHAPSTSENQQQASGVFPQPGFETIDARSPEDTISSATREVSPDTREYRNTAYHISLLYPEDLTVKSYDEGKGAATITFQNPATAKGFQIFIVPYELSKISKDRFWQDVPSGVMRGEMNVNISGVPAVSFYSVNEILGETAEIWFLHRGYLYEVTAPKSNASWLSGIIQTWNFI